MESPNIVLLTLDSCRYDVLVRASTPNLDRIGQTHAAETSATFTLPAHHAFFSGIFPNARVDQPHINRFHTQLLALTGVGETQVAKRATHRFEGDWNLVQAMSDNGYLTVGAGAMNWFQQRSLQAGFGQFRFTGTDADAQIDYLLASLNGRQPLFGFINFGETHWPYGYGGRTDAPRPVVLARQMRWPPKPEGNVGEDCPAYERQVEAAEFIDSRLGRLFDELPPDTTIIACADHGECFGEDGYWGHGVSHPRVWEVPLIIGRLDGAPLA